MFNLFSKKPKETPRLISPLSDLGCDMHSHLLPGIDDGAPDVDASMLLIAGLVKHGYKKLICTPHIFKELYPNTSETISNAYQTLLPHVKERFPDVQINFAAEYYMDDFFDTMLERNEKFLTVQDNWVLVEHSFLQPPQNLKEKIFNLQLAGYTPVLAHPERYEFYAKNVKAYDALYDSGCIFQLNLLSLVGYYGKVAQDLARHLIKMKYVRLLGTDMHHQRHLDALQSVNGSKYILELLNQGKLLNSSLL
jgi:protein-tyrosine phosphatase